MEVPKSQNLCLSRIVFKQIAHKSRARAKKFPHWLPFYSRQQLRVHKNASIFTSSGHGKVTDLSKIGYLDGSFA